VRNFTGKGDIAWRGSRSLFFGSEGFVSSLGSRNKIRRGEEEGTLWEGKTHGREGRYRKEEAHRDFRAGLNQGLEKMSGEKKKKTGKRVLEGAWEERRLRWRGAVNVKLRTITWPFGGKARCGE